jgi:hypothetical protein
MEKPTSSTQRSKNNGASVDEDSITHESYSNDAQQCTNNQENLRNCIDRVSILTDSISNNKQGVIHLFESSLLMSEDSVQEYSDREIEVQPEISLSMEQCDDDI